MAQVSKAVASFRARFEAVDEGDRLARRATRSLSAEARLRECVDLHALNLLLDLERARNSPGVSTLGEAIRRANSERLAAAPMPPALLSRWPGRGDGL